MKISVTIRIFLLFHLVIAAGAAGRTSSSPSDELDTIRRGIALRGETWTARETPQLRMDLEDFQVLLMPLDALPGEGPSNYTPRGYPRETERLDWRYHGGDFVTGVRDQGDCACCWNMAACAVMESAFLIATGDGSGRDFDLSEQHVLSCLDDFGAPGGCGSGSPYNVFRFASEWGMLEEACLPYQGDPSIPCGQGCSGADSGTFFFGEQGEVTVQGSDVDLIRDALHNIGPLTATMAVYETFRAYGGGVYVASGERVGGHLVTIIGYDAPGEYWIAKNSWGEDWGMDGFFYIAWESGCNFASSTRWCVFDPEGPPRARMEFHPAKPLVSETIGFYDRSLIVAPGFGEPIVDWQWDFQDDGIWDAQGRGPHFHVYQEAGDYAARLRVTDAGGTSAETVVQIEVGLLGMEPPDPEILALHPCFPNPFNASTRIVYDLPEGGGQIRLSLFDSEGRLLRVLVEGWKSGGRHSLSFDGRDAEGETLSSGIYLYRLQGPDRTLTRKMSLLQ